MVLSELGSHSASQTALAKSGKIPPIRATGGTCRRKKDWRLPDLRAIAATAVQSLAMSSLLASSARWRATQ